ncbi:MAG: hypothetical protein ACLR56_04260 [Oscillospiraceae bacterium]
MRNANVTAVSVSSDELKINTNEAALRLKIPRGYESEEIKRCNLALKSVLAANTRMSACRSSLRKPEFVIWASAT